MLVSSGATPLPQRCDSGRARGERSARAVQTAESKARSRTCGFDFKLSSDDGLLTRNQGWEVIQPMNQNGEIDVVRLKRRTVVQGQEELVRHGFEGSRMSVADVLVDRSG